MRYNESSSFGVSRYVYCGEQLFALTQETYPKENERPMRVAYALISDYAIIARDNKVSIIGIFDEIHAPILPFQLPSIHFVVGLEAEAVEVADPAMEFDLRIEFHAQDGQSVFSRSTPIRFPPPKRAGDPSRHTEVMGIGGMLFPIAGDYALIVMVNGIQYGRTTLRVLEPGT